MSADLSNSSKDMALVDAKSLLSQILGNPIPTSTSSPESSMESISEFPFLFADVGAQPVFDFPSESMVEDPLSMDSSAEGANFMNDLFELLGSEASVAAAFAPSASDLSLLQQMSSEEKSFSVANTDMNINDGAFNVSMDTFPFVSPAPPSSSILSPALTDASFLSPFLGLGSSPLSPATGLSSLNTSPEMCLTSPSFQQDSLISSPEFSSSVDLLFPSMSATLQLIHQQQQELQQQQQLQVAAMLLKMVKDKSFQHQQQQLQRQQQRQELEKQLLLSSIEVPADQSFNSQEQVVSKLRNILEQARLYSPDVTPAVTLPSLQSKEDAIMIPTTAAEDDDDDDDEEEEENEEELNSHMSIIAPTSPSTNSSAASEKVSGQKSLGTSKKLPDDVIAAFASSLVSAPSKRKGKVGRKRKERPTDPHLIEVELAAKRAKNTEAARRSRQRRLQKVETLELRIQELEEQNAKLEESLSRAQKLLSSQGLNV